MSLVNIQFAKTYLSKLLARVKNGEDVIIANRGVPFAKIVPYTEEVSRNELLGSDQGSVIVPESFFDPIPQENLMPFYEEEV